MSETLDKSMCERLIDYAYGELKGEQASAFESHLAGCAKCQAEVAALKRVRTVMHRALPMVEPPSALTGAMHAQLLHAAAARAGGGGKVLPFRRRVQRVMTHPAFAVAATIAVVGGAVGLQWSRGQLMMPQQVAVETTATPPVAAAPAAPEPVAGVKELEQPQANKPAGRPSSDGIGNAVKDPFGEDNPGFGGGGMVPRPAVELHRDKVQPTKAKDRDVQLFLGTGSNSAPLKVEAKRPRDLKKTYAEEDSGAGSRGALGDPFATPERKAPASPPPPAASPSRRAESASSRVVDDERLAEPAPAAGAVPAPAATKAQSQSGRTERSPTRRPDGLGEGAAELPAASAEKQEYARKADDSDWQALRTKAEKLAESGQCEEAVKLYERLEQQGHPLTPQQRLPYVRCLRQGSQAIESAPALDQQPRLDKKRSKPSKSR